MRKALLSILPLAILLVSLMIPLNTVYAQVPKGPFVDRITFFRQTSEDTAILQIEKDEMDFWYFNLRKKANIEKVLVSPKHKAHLSWGGAWDILVNPFGPELETGFNPFAIREAREALNWLIDREFIIKEFMGGRGAPRWIVFRTVAPDYLRIIDYAKQLEAEYKYNFDRGKEALFTALAKVPGVTFEEGKWKYKGQDIVVRFLIRPEDERKDIGDYIASQLEKLGFTVARDYKTAAAAFRLWGATGPTKRGEWHLYTAGWAFTAISAYDDSDAEFFDFAHVPWLAEYPANPLYKDLASKLARAEYKSAEERIDWLKRIAFLGLKEGVTIWLADQFIVFPYHPRIGAFVYDLYGGMWTRWVFFTARVTTGPNELKIGNRLMFIEGFNPIGGFGWLYDVPAYYMVHDYGLFPHPHVGTYIPIRADFKVETKGPEGKLDVPADALKFDPIGQAWKPVGPDVKAASKVTFKFNYGKWHHGQPMTMADILMGIAATYLIATEGTPYYEPVLAVLPSVVTFMQKFKGIKFIAPDTAEVYMDYWHVDSSFIAATSSVWTSIPWESYALMLEIWKGKKAALTTDMSDALAIEMLDLTKGPTLDILKTYLANFTAINFIPKALSERVTATDAAARWKALSDWAAAKGHYWVSNGPFIFEKADPVALTFSVVANREYVFPADKWDAMLTPKVVEAKVAEAPVEVVPGLPAKFVITGAVAGAPYEKAIVKFVVTDPRGAFVMSGEAKNIGGGRYEISLPAEVTAGLAVGTYTLVLMAYSLEAALATTATASFTVIPEIAYFERLVKGVEADARSRIDAVSTKLGDTERAIRADIAALQGTLNLVLALAVVALIIGIVGVVLALRRPKPPEKPA